MKKENIEKLQNLIRDRTDDEALAILEVISEEEKEVDWQSKYEENDANWRKRYAERFNDTSNVKQIEKDDKEDEEEKRLSSLHLSQFF